MILGEHSIAMRLLTPVSKEEKELSRCDDGTLQSFGICGKLNAITRAVCKIPAVNDVLDSGTLMLGDPTKLREAQGSCS
jgi:hypothetical protein